MKRKVSVILGICTLMLIALSSCSLDDLQGNLYEKMGLIDIENPSAQKVSELVDSIETAKPSEEGENKWVNAGASDSEKILNVTNIDGFKDIAEAIDKISNESGSGELEITIDSYTADLITKNGILKPQDKEKEELYASLGSALGSSSGTKNLVDSMSQEAPKEQSDAAKGTMALTNSLISQITNSMGGEDSEMPAEIKDVLDTLKVELAYKSKQTESLSKAEVLQVQMVTNLVSSVANAANVLKENEDMSELMKKDEVIAIMDDLTLLSNVTNALSGSTSVLSIPNISELIQSFTNSSNGDGSQEVQA